MDTEANIAYENGNIEKLKSVLDMRSGKEIFNLIGHNDCILSLTTSPNSNILVSKSTDKIVKIWNLNKGKLIQTISDFTEQLKKIVISEDEAMIVTTDLKGTMKVWKLC